jgi:hypothetical protein
MITFQQKQELTNCVSDVINLNYKMNDTLVGILKLQDSEVLRTHDTNNRTTIYAIEFDEELLKYVERKVIAVTFFNNKEVGVLLGSEYATLDGMTDDEILELDGWYSVFGGYRQQSATLCTLCENIQEYL